MKPVIRKLLGFWCCSVHRNSWLGNFGVGWTPKEAYEDWVMAGGKDD
jgi:hypothetical protein